MIGRKKLSTIREELREAYVAERVNPIIALDCRIRELKRKSRSTDVDVLRSLATFREALAEIVEAKPSKPAPNRGAKKRAKKAV